MQQLRSQVQSLARTMQLSFDLQLEIQRSIRQEVSASLARGQATTGTSCVTWITIKLSILFSKHKIKRDGWCRHQRTPSPILKCYRICSYSCPDFCVMYLLCEERNCVKCCLENATRGNGWERGERIRERIRERGGERRESERLSTFNFYDR